MPQSSSADTVFGLPLWVAALVMTLGTSLWLYLALKTRVSPKFGFMPSFRRDQQPMGYWVAMALVGFALAVGVLSIIVPNWVTLVPGQPFGH
jgi:hypothetical protein